MVHMILAKFRDRSLLTPGLTEEIRTLFSGAEAIEGVEGASVSRCCVDRDNRYDLLIRVYMQKDALPRWDESAVHAEWKKKYGEMLEKKAIFDEE